MEYIGYLPDANQVKQLLYGSFISVVQHRLDNSLKAQIGFVLGFHPPEQGAVVLDKITDFCIVHHYKVDLG